MKKLWQQVWSFLESTIFEGYLIRFFWQLRVQIFELSSISFDGSTFDFSDEFIPIMYFKVLKTKTSFKGMMTSVLKRDEFSIPIPPGPESYFFSNPHPECYYYFQSRSRHKWKCSIPIPFQNTAKDFWVRSFINILKMPWWANGVVN